MLSIAEIKKLIEGDKNSKRKKAAKEGQRYYDGDHDIQYMSFFYYDEEDNLVEDKERSNIKISHTFFTELVDQEVQYILSGDKKIVCSDDEKLQELLDPYFNNDSFIGLLSDVMTGAIAKGWDYVYAYKGKDDRTKFQLANSLSVIEATAYDGRKHMIYYYSDGYIKEKPITRIQVWDSEQAYFYVQIGNGVIKLDDEEKINPRPHILYTEDDEEDIYYNCYGMIPFFRLDNNKKKVSGLKTIKGIIDDYDLMSCGLSNNIQDATEILYVVKGFKGNDVGKLIHNVKTKKVVGTSADGDVEQRTGQIPYEARMKKLEVDEKNIYKFGMGFNSAQIGDGNITNIVIKSRYALLDLKCNKFEKQLKAFMSKLISLVLGEINDKGHNYTMNDVYCEFEREIMTNSKDNAEIAQIKANTRQTEINTLMAVAEELDNETLLKAICETLDVDYEEVKAKLEDLKPNIEPVEE